MAAVKVNFDEGDLAAIDRVRGDVPRERWIRRLCMDGVAAAENLRPAVQATSAMRERSLEPEVAAPTREAMIDRIVGATRNGPKADPEDGPLSYDAERDEPIREATGHDGQPCRCPECTELRRAARQAAA